MSGRVLQAMMMVLTCYVAGQQPGAVAAEADSSDLENRLERLEAIYERNMQKQKETNIKQADQLENQAEVIAELSDRMAGLELENQKQARVISYQSEMISDLKLEQSQQDNIVAFTSTASVTRVYSAGDRVLFDSVLTNYGDSYDSLTSIFTCSVSGYYLFSVTVMTDSDGAMYAQIQLHDTPLVAAYSTDWETGSNLVVTYCAEGQTVWVMCLVGGGVMYEDGGRFATFSGTLLTLA